MNSKHAVRFCSTSLVIPHMEWPLKLIGAPPCWSKMNIFAEGSPDAHYCRTYNIWWLVLHNWPGPRYCCKSSAHRWGLKCNLLGKQQSTGCGDKLVNPSVKNNFFISHYWLTNWKESRDSCSHLTNHINNTHWNSHSKL